MRRLMILLLFLFPNVGYSEPNVLIPQEYEIIDQDQHRIPIEHIIDMPAVRERLLHDIDFQALRWEPFEHLNAYEIHNTIMVVWAPVAEVGTYFLISPQESTVIGTFPGNRLYGVVDGASFQFWSTFAHGGGSDLVEYTFYTRKGTEPLQHKYSILVEETSTEIPSESNLVGSVETIQEPCLLRTTPDILQTPNIGSEDHLRCRTYGNIVVEYPMGSTGQAVYEKLVDDGRVWYFVIMEVNEGAQSCYFYPGLKKETFAGWMNGECVHVTPPR